MFVWLGLSCVCLARAELLFVWLGLSCVCLARAELCLFG